MSQTTVRRTRVGPVDPGLLSSLRAEAARTGILHASDDLVVCGFGSALGVLLHNGLAAPETPALLADALASVRLSGDDGPGGTGVVALGSLPFDAAAPAELRVPRVLCSWEPAGAALWVSVAGPPASGALEEAERIASRAASLAALPSIERLDLQMTEAAYKSAVSRAVDALRAGRLDKVVLARSVVGRCAGPIDIAALAASLHEIEPSCTLYAFPSDSRRFVGSSPELLVATSDGAVSAHPLAGTVALTGSALDASKLDWLSRSAKNRIEHHVVVEDIVSRLEPLCDSVSAPASPSVVQLSSVAHLGTWVDGKLRARGVASAVQALAALHPTPAVGGVPRSAALELIDEVEPVRRGPWAGPVGWVDADGASTWTLGLRGMLVEGHAFEAWAGAGIVADSDPREELAETEVKLSSVLRALGA